MAFDLTYATDLKLFIVIYYYAIILYKSLTTIII